jgi:hypothetical protein
LGRVGNAFDPYFLKARRVAYTWQMCFRIREHSSDRPIPIRLHLSGFDRVALDDGGALRVARGSDADDTKYMPQRPAGRGRA